MATPPQSRNPFSDPNLPSFELLLDALKCDQELSATKRQNWMWALKAAARACGKAPADIVAHPEYLRAIMRKAAPTTIGLSRPAWNNVRSLVGKVLEWAGLASMPAHYMAPFAPAWEALWHKLPGPKDALRMQLSRLAHYCSAQGISPEAVNDDVLGPFREALITESFVKDPEEVFRGAAKSWNNAAARIPGWPQERLTVPSRQRHFCLPWNAFPPALHHDVDTYCLRAAGLDLSDDHFVHPQRPTTIETRRRQLLLLATAVVKSGVSAEALTNLRALVDPETAAAGLQHLIGRNGGKSGPQISQLATFLPTLARRLDMPEQVTARLRKIALKLKVTQRGMTERNREALRAFDDEESVRALVMLPALLREEVLKSGGSGHQEAKTIQTALAIDLLLNAPIRVQNLASIEIDRHLVSIDSGREKCVLLRFPAHEVKNANDLEFPLLPETVDLLDSYLRVWRPILCSYSTTPFLFPGDFADQPKGKGTLSAQIKKLVFAYTRLDMPAHRFRHAAGKIYLDQNPGQYEVVRQLLGHKDISTTIAFYTGAETASAARHYARTIVALRHRESRMENI
jgi:integrase